MSKTGTHAVYVALASAAAVLASPPAAAATETCSAWIEPARIEQQIQLRQRKRMRADIAWVREVARNPQAKLDSDGTRITPREHAELQAQFEARWRANEQRQPMIQQAQAYAEQHADEFAGSYLRSASNDFLDPPLAYVMRFTGNLTGHRKALQSLPPTDIPVEILPARHTLKKLEAIATALFDRYEALQTGSGVKLVSYGVDVTKNLVELEVESAASDAVARLTAGFGDLVQTTVHPMFDASKQADVTRGPGWRLLGRVRRRAVTSEAEGTRLAASAVEWQALRTETNLPLPAEAADFRKEVVLTFTSSACFGTYLDGVVIDRRLRSIEPKFSPAGSPRLQRCALMYTGHEVFAIAIERAALPANPVTVPTRHNAAQFKDPAYCPRGLVIPRQ